MESIPLGLYVHTPWCIEKCPYCDFNSHKKPADGFDEHRYIDALLADLEKSVASVWGRSLHSIFIGGGTPSLFQPESIHRLLSGVRQLLAYDPNIEITMEANPGAIDQAHFHDFSAAGINRLSIGIQSFNNEHLHALGRIHNAMDSHSAVATAVQSGFHNINLDLMFGLPDQTVTQCLSDVRQAIELQPTHISLYQLTIEPNTLFHHRPPHLPDDDIRYRMQTEGKACLADAGFHQYEVSAYARDKHQCQHNVNYWEFGDYLGIGAGAHGKITDMGRQKITRTTKKRHPNDYMKILDGGTVEASHEVSESKLSFEYMLNRLRLHDSFARSDYENRTGLPWSRVRNTVKQSLDKQLLKTSPPGYQTTDLGKRFLDDLVEMYL